MEAKMDSISSALNIASSGLQAASTILTVAAQNAANATTPGYKAAEVDLLSAGGGGVEVDRVSEDPNADPVSQAIEFRRAEFLYDANAQVIATEEQMFGSLINMVDNAPPQPPE
jgi:flagellar hook-associated protein FlgK